MFIEDLFSNDKLWPCLAPIFFCKMNTIAFSFIFDKYYLIMN